MSPDCRVDQWALLGFQEDALDKLTRYARVSDAILLVGGYDRNLREVPRCCPAVGVEMGSSFNGWVSILSLDPFDAAERATQYFCDRNVHHLHLIYNPVDPLHSERKDIMLRVWRQHGTYDEEAAYGDEDPSHGWWFSGGTGYNRFALKYSEILAPRTNSTSNASSPIALMVSKASLGVLLPGGYPAGPNLMRGLSTVDYLECTLTKTDMQVHEDRDGCQAGSHPGMRTGTQMDQERGFLGGCSGR